MGLTLPLIEGCVVPRRAQAYAEKRYGDHKAPLTQEEKDEWFYEMGVKSGEKPNIHMLKHYNHKCRYHVFFGKSPRY
jgi:hypothetical protein